MLKEIFNNIYINKFFAVFFLGFAIKILDDFLDDNENAGIRAIMPYSLLLLSVSALLDLSSISLFLSSYIIGMFKDFKLKLPSGFFSWGESVFVYILGMLFLGFKEITASISIIIFIQLIDDLIDYKYDKMVGQKNYAIKYGSIETALIGVVFLSAALMMDFSKTIIVILVTPLVLLCYKRINKTGGNTN